MLAKSLAVNQCNHVNARGRRCRMLIASDEESFCIHHLAKSTIAPLDDEAVADALLSSTGALTTAGDVNALLRNVAKLLACRMIDRKEAVAFGYLSQMLLCSFSGIDEKLEAKRDALALDEVNKDIREMRASFLAHRATADAAKAAQASQKSQNNSPTRTTDSSSPAPQHKPSNIPPSPEPVAPQSPRDDCGMRT